jgi:hypothetical protein
VHGRERDNTRHLSKSTPKIFEIHLRTLTRTLTFEKIQTYRGYIRVHTHTWTLTFPLGHLRGTLPKKLATLPGDTVSIAIDGLYG